MTITKRRLLTFSLFLSWPVLSLAATITVDDDGLADYSSIKEAVEAASEGDTVFVKAGTYNDIDVRIEKEDLVLQGEGADVTFFKPRSGQIRATTRVIIYAQHAKVDGFTFDGGNLLLYEGIRAGTTATITNNRIINSTGAIYLVTEYCPPFKGWGIISGNTITNNEYGITVSWSEYIPISAMDIRWNWWGTSSAEGIDEVFSHFLAYPDYPVTSLLQYDPWLKAPATKAVLQAGIHYNNIFDNGRDFDFGIWIDDTGIGIRCEDREDVQPESWGKIKAQMRR